jgi:dTDP-4-dehydrorhamnose reductase
MRILITGAGGQLGRALSRRAASHDVLALPHAESDVTDLAIVAAIVAARPDLVVNAAAMTDVDGCEEDPDAAFRVNALGARNVALGAERAGADLVQVSTDYVFDGAAGRAYWEFDAPSPISVYGASKLAGEALVRDVCRRCYVVRTSWLFGLGGHNFVTKILVLAETRPSLEVVDTEVGSPTFCDDLAEAIVALAATRAYGTYHLSNEGACSRFAFARAILDQAGRAEYPLAPIARYPRRARPPVFAPLRNFAAAELGVSLPPWPEALARYFERGGATRA